MSNHFTGHVARVVASLGVAGELVADKMPSTQTAEDTVAHGLAAAPARS